MQLLKIFFIVALISGNHSFTEEKYVIGHWAGGLAIGITSALNHLLYCEETKKTPVIYWGDGSYYYVPGGFNHRYNAWEYYFEPVSHLNYVPGDTIHFYCNEKECGTFSYYRTSQPYLDLAHQLVTKYIKVNQIVQAKIDHFYNSHMLGKRTIGIHIRGTDKIFEERPIPPHRIIEEALKYADEDVQFLIASDEKKILDEMRMLLGGRKVIYYNCYRSEDGKPLHLPNKDRNVNVAQNGEDVVVEMLLMSKCDLFLHTLSNVSTLPLYFNPQLNHITMRE